MKNATKTMNLNAFNFIMSSFRLSANTNISEDEFMDFYRHHKNDVSMIAPIASPKYSRVREAILKDSGYNAEYFSDLSEKEMLIAVKNAKYAIHSILKRHNENDIPLSVYVESVKLSYESYNVFPENIKNTYKAELVNANPNILRFASNFTEDDVLAVLRIDPRHIRHLNNPSQEAIKYVVSRDKKLINEIDVAKISLDTWLYLMSIDSLKLELCHDIDRIPNFIKTLYAAKNPTAAVYFEPTDELISAAVGALKIENDPVKSRIFYRAMKSKESMLSENAKELISSLR